MKLSEAIRLGSLLVPQPQRGVVENCAIGMAVKAVGDFKVAGESGEQAPSCYYTALSERWRWVKHALAFCACGNPKCVNSNTPIKLAGPAIIFYPFDQHVVGDKKLTIDQLADFIASIEPAEDTAPSPKSEFIPVSESFSVEVEVQK